MMRYLLHHLLDEAARAHPVRPAVMDSDRRISYEELKARSDRLATVLRDAGVSRGDRVGVYLEKSLESVEALYGIMKAGAAYVPFDPEAPVSRLAYIAIDCGIHHLVSGVEKQGQWAALLEAGAPVETLFLLNGEAADVRIPELTVVDRADIAESDADPVDVTLIDEDLAYILYTSGSTGDPKGVMLTHRNALAFVEWAAEEFEVTHDDRLSSHAPFHFDLSIFDLYAAAHGSAAVVLVPPKTSIFPGQVADFIRSNEISIWYSVPSVLTMLTLRGGLSRGDLASLRLVLFAGEVFPTRYLQNLMRLVPQARFVNLYGPTETNVCTWYEVPPLDDVEPPIPIGSAVPNDEVFAVTDRGEIAQVGEIGELHVRGASVMAGYWGDSERTRRAFSEQESNRQIRAPAYRTGDLVEVLPGHSFRYIGRRDGQIKSRGYRIELGEIEAAMYTHPAVVECAVIAVPDDVVTNRLVAFVAIRDETTERDLVSFCVDRLPRYMLPETFHRLAGLPKTSTGKIDRRSLAAMVET